MKHIQVVDGADNCVFPVYAVSERDFKLLFPAHGQNVEFAQDLALRLGGEREAGQLIMRCTAEHVNKSTITGIHGTLFINLPNRRRHFPNKRESDVFVP